MHRILYVEDDESLAFLTADNLAMAGYEIIHVHNGYDALKLFKETKFDLCLLDIMVPSVDGFSLAEEIRKLNQDVPILFLTAKTLKEDRVKGLKLGGDDYILKPFSIEELALKIKVFLSRPRKHDFQASLIKLGDFLFDENKQCLINNEKELIKLTHKQSQLLKLLTENKNKILRREEILLNIWGDDDYFLGRSMDVLISRLRKILAADASLSIENIYGVGFRLCESPDNH